MREGTPRISVVMPFHNDANHLPEAIALILEQTYQDVESVLINDGSIDNTAAILTHYQQQDSCR